MPEAGFKNPRFPTVGPADIEPPTGGYQSAISTQAPIDQSKLRRIMSVTQQPQSYGGGAGNASRSALSQALTDFSTQAVGGAADKFNTQYRQQAEKARAEDVLAQRQNAGDRYDMNVNKAIFGADTDLRYTSGIKDLWQYWSTERANENAKQTAMWLSMIGGLI
jgi:hypothetical protein